MLDLKAWISKVTAEIKVIQTGSVTITNVSTTEKSTNVTFSKTYSSAPKVVASLNTASYNRRIHVTNVTTTGFTIVTALNSGSSTASVWVDWIAVGGVARKLLNTLKTLTLGRGWATC